MIRFSSLHNKKKKHIFIQQSQSGNLSLLSALQFCLLLFAENSMNQCLQHVSEVSPVFWVKPSYSATTVFQRMILRFPKPLIYCLLISTKN